MSYSSQRSSHMSTDPVLALTDLEFGYAPKQTIISINRFDIGRGESVFLRGPSGSGKSTLLGLMGGILEPGSGRIEICGTDMTSASATGRDKLRAHHMGIIFQQLNLLPYLDVIANVTLPCRFSQNRAAKAAIPTTLLCISYPQNTESSLMMMNF